MRFIQCLLFAIGLSLISSCSHLSKWSKGTNPDNNNKTTIGFGSCLDQDASAPIFQAILKSPPQIFLFMGDNGYLDKPELKDPADGYRKISKQIYFEELSKKSQVYAIWDDHDFGLDDGGKAWEKKDLYRKAYLDFWKNDSALIGKSSAGINHSVVVPQACNNEIRIILLDTRTFRSPLLHGTSAATPEYIPDDSQTKSILGETQWLWLEEELKKESDIVILVSSIQVIPTGHPFEKWNNLPRERSRLLNLIDQYPQKTIILLSGDRHKGSIAKIQLPHYGELYEVTSSSLNQALRKQTPEKDPTYLEPSYPKENVGFLEIDRGHRKAFIKLLDIEGLPVQQATVDLRNELNKPCTGMMINPK